MTTDLHKMFDVRTEIVFDEQQKEAIAAVCDTSRRIVAVTGKAGTGKTLIIKEAVRLIQDAGHSVAVCAPTGKAAKRIKESTGIDAVTNHRLLGYGMPREKVEEDANGDVHMVKLSTGPRFKQDNRLPFDFIICDEYAMVNHEIHRNLINAMKAGGKLRVFGDINQLRPIEEDFTKREDSPFEDLLKRFKGIELLTIHRHDEGSGIADNGARILKGRLPIKKPDFEIHMTQEPVKFLARYVEEQLDAGVDFGGVENQIITCMNKSWIGTKKLNAALVGIFWKKEYESILLPRHRWDGGDEAAIRVQVGTKVVYTSNTYDLGNGQSVFNGEQGLVVNIDHKTGAIDIDFMDRIATIPGRTVIKKANGNKVETDPRRNIDLAYALTTHKMQGSECRRIIYVLNKSTMYGQSRRNFYTAVTRARERATVITDMPSLTKSTRVEE